MADLIEVKADTDLQILRVRLQGDFNLADVEEMVSQTTAAVRDLDDPDNVRVLGDGRGMGKASLDARKKMIENLKRPNMERYAMWGASRPRALFMSVLFRTLGITIFRFFQTEEQALAWLMEGR